LYADTPWHRHVTACMLATAFLAVQRAAIPEPGQTLESEPDAHPEQAPDQGKAPGIDESEAAG
jgi:SRSO17 transposase